MISMQTNIPEVWDVSEAGMRNWMAQVTQFCYELARKAQQVQENYQATTPSVADFPTENSVILYDNGVTRRAFYLINGAVRYASLT